MLDMPPTPLITTMYVHLECTSLAVPEFIFYLALKYCVALYKEFCLHFTFTLGSPLV